MSCACCGRASWSWPRAPTWRRCRRPAARGLPLTRVEPWQFDRDGARRALVEQFKTRGLEGFGLDGHDAAIAAAGALVAYLRDSQKADLAHVRSISFPPAGRRICSSTR